MDGLMEIWRFLRNIPRWLLLFFTNNVAVTVLGIAFIGAGVYVRHSGRFGEYKDGIGALCDALVIAAFLKVTVDPVLKRELTKDAARDVFLYAFGYSLPGELRAFVNDLVLETKFVRRRCRLEWHLQPKPGDEKKLQVTLEASFYIVNFSGSYVRYRHQVYSWKENPEDPGCVRAMFCEPKHAGDKKYRMEKNEGLTPEKDGYIRGEVIKLPPHSEDDRVRVGAVYFTEADRNGLDQFNIMEPTMEIDVVVIADDLLSDLEFAIMPDLSEKKTSENYSLLERNKETAQLEHAWELKRVFVPNERVLIRWRKSEAKPLSFLQIS